MKAKFRKNQRESLTRSQAAEHKTRLHSSF